MTGEVAAGRIGPAWMAVLGDVGRLARSTLRAGDSDAARRLPGEAAAMLLDTRDLARAMTVAGDRAARWVPGYPEALDQLRTAETALLREVRRRLDEVAATHTPEERDSERARLLERLLRESLDADSERSRTELHLRILRSLVPDEARILAALSDGTRYPLVHVETRGLGPSRTLVANASTVGRIAAVMLHEAVPVYMTHLRILGLVEEGPKDETLSDQYALLTSEDPVRRVLAEGGDGLRGHRVVHSTVRLSPLGRQLWEACRPTEPVRRVEAPGELYRSAYAPPPPTAPPRRNGR